MSDYKLVTLPQARAYESSVALNPKPGFLSAMRYYYYLPIAFSRIIFFALKQKQHSPTDLRVLLFLFMTPWLYALNFRGSLKTPFGRVIVTDRDKIRSVTHGAFKTYFGYLRDLRFLIRATFFPVVVDVGANVGDFCLALAHRCGRIIAIEPGSANFNSLKANIRANGIRNVVTLNIAAHN